MGPFSSPQPPSVHQKSKRRILSAPLLEEGPVRERGRQTGNDQEERRLSNALEGMKEGVMPLLRGWENVQSQGWGDSLVCVLADLVSVIPGLPLTIG